jgi:hypothetical protein
VAKTVLANDDDVIKTFPSDRADQPLRISVLKDRRLHLIHSIDHGCFGSRMYSIRCMDESSHLLSGGLFGVRNASIFMTIMALSGLRALRLHLGFCPHQ